MTDRRFFSGLTAYGQAAAGVATGLMVKNLVDRWVSVHFQAGSLWMRVHNQSVPPAVIAAAFNTQRKWQQKEIVDLRIRVKLLETRLEEIKWRTELP